MSTDNPPAHTGVRKVDDMHYEFTCKTCDTYVYLISPVPPTHQMCAECAWIEGIADPVERAKIRAHFDGLRERRRGGA